MLWPYPDFRTRLELSAWAARPNLEWNGLTTTDKILGADRQLARHPVPGRVSAGRVHTHEMTVSSGHSRGAHREDTMRFRVCSARQGVQARPVARAAFFATRLSPAPVFRTALFADFIAFVVLDFLRLAFFMIPPVPRFVQLGPPAIPLPQKPALAKAELGEAPAG
jgi:hypothetical protein